MNEVLQNSLPPTSMSSKQRKQVSNSINESPLIYLAAIMMWGCGERTFQLLRNSLDIAVLTNIEDTFFWIRPFTRNGLYFALIYVV